MSTLIAQQHWQAPDQLKIKREPGFAYRYIKKSDVERRIDEGWEIVASPLKEKKEGGAVDKAVHYRGLILMRITQLMAAERNAHYRNLHNRRLRAVARGAGMSATGRAATHNNDNADDLAGTIGAGLKVKQGVVTDEGLVHSDNITIPVDAHPDDLQEDAAVAAQLKKDKESQPEGGEGVKPPKPKLKRR